MTTTVITGSASGMGAATKRRLAAEGHRVIDIDIRDADIIADLSQPDARKRALDEVLARCDGRLDRLVLCACQIGACLLPCNIANNDDGLMCLTFGYPHTLSVLTEMLEQRLLCEPFTFLGVRPPTVDCIEGC